jgi:hypothetical protein
VFIEAVDGLKEGFGAAEVLGVLCHDATLTAFGLGCQ